MHVTVTFRHMESSEALKSYAIEKTDRLGKYLFDPIEVHWVLSVEKIRHIADCTIVANGVTTKAQGDTQDMYSAIDMVLEKLEKQVRKHKEKVKDHKPHTNEGGSIRFPAEGSAEAGRSPRVVRKENQFAKPMSVEEAVMQVEAIKSAFLVFTDSSSNNISVVYRLDGGDYGLIETTK
ncbi:MAG: ribosome-associated translation inhibitor RaiA [Deltaproteobacteria bacterium]|nr:ribosome-associated translation inhibitor RaiA [Deltaproteobacteria bacterium]